MISRQKQILLIVYLVVGALTFSHTAAQDPIASPVIIDNFDYADPSAFRWQVSTSEGGNANLVLDNQSLAPVPNNATALFVESTVPCLTEGGRFQHMELFLDTPLPANLNILEFWVRGDGVREAPFWGNLTVTLIENSGEVWASSQLVAKDTDWKLVTLELTGSPSGDPTQHPGKFVLRGTQPTNSILDVADIRAIRIEAITTDPWACGTASAANGTPYPNFKLWIDQLVARQGDIVTIENFETVPAEVVGWETVATEGGSINAQFDATNFAPLADNTHSLQLQTNLACTPGGSRDAYVQFRIPQNARDWRNSRVLEFWVKGDGIAEPPFVGDVVVSLLEDSGELWASIRQINRQSDWQLVSIQLSGSTVENPRLHPNDFSIPPRSTQRVINGVLDLDDIRLVRIGSYTSDVWSCGIPAAANGTPYPSFTTWIDEITRK